MFRDLIKEIRLLNDAMICQTCQCLSATDRCVSILWKYAKMQFFRWIFNKSTQFALKSSFQLGCPLNRSAYQNYILLLQYIICIANDPRTQENIYLNIYLWVRFYSDLLRGLFFLMITCLHGYSTYKWSFMALLLRLQHLQPATHIHHEPCVVDMQGEGLCPRVSW